MNQELPVQLDPQYLDTGRDECYMESPHMEKTPLNKVFPVQLDPWYSAYWEGRMWYIESPDTENKLRNRVSGSARPLVKSKYREEERDKLRTTPEKIPLN